MEVGETPAAAALGKWAAGKPAVVSMLLQKLRLPPVEVSALPGLGDGGSAIPNCRAPLLVLQPRGSLCALCERAVVMASVRARDTMPVRGAACRMSRPARSCWR